ncbi:hypothetical protein [Nocardia sp. NPDC050793]|uniref:hypothetical protein n=1 Tax=Nocardia sp. NPDC050793 TaxID=3155159 RepID=UPI0033EF8827
MGTPPHEWLANVASYGVPVIAVPRHVYNFFHARSEAQTQEENFNDQQSKAQNQWDTDRQIVNKTWSDLQSQYDGRYADRVVVGDKKESFLSQSHEWIYNHLKDVKQVEINEAANGWRDMVREAERLVSDFSTGVQRDIDDFMEGKTANAVVESTKSYADEMKKLIVTFNMVARGLDLTEGYLTQAQQTVDEPHSLSLIDQVIGHIPGNGVFKSAQYRADEAENRVRDFMDRVYQPGVVDEVDPYTPILPEPKSTIDDSKKPGDTPGPGPGPGPGGGPNPGSDIPIPGSPISEIPGTDPGGEAPDTPGSDPEDTDQTNPASTQTPTTPQSTTPAATVPDTKLPNTGLPTPSGPGPGAPGPGVPTIPSPGRSVPGGNVPGQSGPSGGLANSRPAGTGRAGMPGMGAPAARGKGDDDDEHKTPDYLIYDHGDELLGTQPPALPPGGVIGG